MTITKAIKLTVISDIVRSPPCLLSSPNALIRPLIDSQICPWCYIGQRELDSALEMCKDLPIQVEIEYRPYRIYPSLHDGQFIDKRKWYESKFGGEKIKTMENMVLPRARELGIDLYVL